MKPQQRGLYETLITEALAAQLQRLDSHFTSKKAALHPAEAADRIALHLGRIIHRLVEGFDHATRAKLAIRLARQVIQRIDELATNVDVMQDAPIEAGEVLRAILSPRPDGTAETIAAPLIPLLDTTLLTNAPGEPRVGSQLVAEVCSADRIDIVMAFIRRSGIGPFTEILRRHCESGRELRILTTTYTGSTEKSALDTLSDLGASIKVSYDTTITRLHAKAWLFHRVSGFSTAYIGSSNLTHSAQVSGLEWNVRVSGARNPDVISKVAAVFDAYWNDGDFILYDADQFRERTGRPDDSGPTVLLSPIELRPEPYQERLLEQIAVSRRRGYHRNLLVSATGTGKTVMAAVDYTRLRPQMERSRLLFVAHREEILDQSLATFRYALRDASFGELWVGRHRPQDFAHAFASIQSLQASRLNALDPRHFDVVIIDEFHHAAAPSYTRLLNHVDPVELLGLTATPERSDGLPILSWFDNRIAAELRLWDAIDQHRLCPFVYYGVHDGLDLRQIPWRRGVGYEVKELEKVYTANDDWARQVIAQMVAHIENPRTVRALGFCVSVDHARFMARVFQQAGIPSTAVWGDSPDEDRKTALTDLSNGSVNVVFSVDLFNEGIDAPTVDTLLMLRPTDSPLLFIQQLGRGLRRAKGKTVCTVLDFVGHHRREFRIDRRFRALLGGSRNDVIRQVERGFPFLPAGCHMELDRVAAEIVMENLRQSLPSRWPAKVEELRQLRQGGQQVTLAKYMAEAGLQLEDVYSGHKCWSDLVEEAGGSVQASGPNEKLLRRACGRLLHVDDPVRLEAYKSLLKSDSPPDLSTMSERDRRLTRMLVASITSDAVAKTASVPQALSLLWEHPQVRSELLELFAYLTDSIDHVTAGLTLHPEVPLQVHARYTRIEMLAAFGVGDTARVIPWQTGVIWIESAKTDLFAFTLDKTSGNFSPTTRYRDYAISRDLIHWETQSTTRAESETGQRYQNHVKLGTSVMLFARPRNDDRASWFLGPATYVSHESELPMAITWKLHHPLPGDLFTSFAAAVA